MHVAYNLLDNSKGNSNVTYGGYKNITFLSPCWNKSDCTPYIINLSPGVYKFEGWGSSGATSSSALQPGFGAYSKGIIILRKRTKFYLYIGTKTGFNSQKSFSLSVGGGATDIRLVGGDWNNFESLKSRIFVSGGGGGSEWRCSIGGNAGLIGTTGYGCDSINLNTRTNETFYCKGGTQTEGGYGPDKIIFYYHGEKPTYKGMFGSSGDNIVNVDLGGMGGSGYYGGASISFAGGGGGGSSFISGHPECDAISKESTSKTNITHTHNSVHYSGFQFFETEIISGNETMPYYLSQSSFKGNDGDGAFRITLYRELFCSFQMKQHTSRSLAVFLIITLTS